MATFKVRGTVTEIFPLASGQSADGKEWSRQEFLLNTNEQYDTEICIQLSNDYAIKNSQGVIEKGNEVEVSCQVGSKIWNGKYYTNIKYQSSTRIQNTQ